MKTGQAIRRGMRSYGRSLLSGSLLVCCMSCTDWIYEDRSGCDRGVYLNFRYDYNLQRADMFSDHVGGVTVYVFDADGDFVTSRSEANTAGSAPLRAKDYRMHLDLPAGEYRFVALAMQKEVAETQRGPGAKFRIAGPDGGKMEGLSVTLDHAPDGRVEHGGLPLDTLWHAMSPRSVVTSDLYAVSETLSLVRDTKHIDVVLREIDDPAGVDVADYDFRITDRNLRLRYDNSVDESGPAVYTPYVAWNTEDRTGREAAEGVGRMAHVGFMTSRILYHDRAEEDAVLTVTHRETGWEVIRVNLADMLARLRSADELHACSEQEFLDRGYDYRMTFFLKGDTWEAVDLEISVLNWSRRIQNVIL